MTSTPSDTPSPPTDSERARATSRTEPAARPGAPGDEPAPEAIVWKRGTILRLNREAGFGYLAIESQRLAYLFLFGKAILYRNSRDMNVGDRVAFHLDHSGEKVERLVILPKKPRPKCRASPARFRVGYDRGSDAAQPLGPDHRVVATTQTLQRRHRPAMSGSGNAMPPIRTTGVGSAEARMSMPEDLDSLPTKDVGAFIERFAHAHNVSGEQTMLDDWTEAVSRVESDDIRLDRVERLLVAVKRLGLINGRQAARLLTNYMRETKIVQRPTPPDV